MENRRLLIEFNRGIPKIQKELDIIKKDFLINDIMHKDFLRNGEYPDLDFNKTKIQTEVSVGKSVRIVQDKFGFEEEEIDLELDVIEIDFYEEFERALVALFDNYCTKFLNELDRKGVYTFEGIEEYKLVKLKKLNNLISELDKCCDLQEDIKTLISEFYNKVYDFISNFKLENYQISDKLQFKLNKNQVVWLFLSMYDKGVVSGITDLDLYSFLDAHCKYFDKDEYKDMSNSRTQGNKFINGHASPSESIRVLKEKFDEDFFSSST
ncbi:MAG: hypothetical protein ABJM36_02100 [Algibacter sp.]|uniref:hypothetical protein n=1 Tax=Algibacter sp. TaxID=1872428 RepID=UPI0032970B32